jgi:hypothetical protein
MAAIECGKGHMYDPDVYNVCPYCNSGRSVSDIGIQRGGGIPVTSDNRTAPLSPPSPARAPGRASGEVSVTSANKTLPPRAYGLPAGGTSVTDDNKTVGLMKKSMGVEPCVGWLVCVKGADKGKSYELKGRINSIGRSAKNDVTISGDTTISQDNHAKLGYAERGNAFHLVPADNKNIIYMNNDAVYVPTQLKAYDRIVFGDTELLFIPLCGDRFAWSKGGEDEPV